MTLWSEEQEEEEEEKEEGEEVEKEEMEGEEKEIDSLARFWQLCQGMHFSYLGGITELRNAGRE